MAPLTRALNSHVKSSCLHGNPLARSVIRYPVPRISQRAFMWWWKRGGHDHISSQDDSFQQRMHWRQRQIRYRYSKALDRQSLWDRDHSYNTQRPTWLWHKLWLLQSPGRKLPSSKSCSSRSSPPNEKRTSPNTVDEYETFKRRVDEDPFRALFGSRMTFSQNPKDTSWSMFSYDEKGNASEKAFRQSHDSGGQTSALTATSLNPSEASKRSENLQSEKQKSHDTTVTPAPSSTLSDGHGDEYQFDPISMRKVLKAKDSPSMATETNKPLFDPLFAENKAVDIPVKTYKPHRVFGHSARSKSDDGNDNKSMSGLDTKPPRSETSRATELRQLKASKLGNSLDTTAEYHGKWTPPSDEAELAPKSRSDIKAAASDTLFEGTTYEGKFGQKLEESTIPGRGWLQREGFASDQNASRIPPAVVGISKEASEAQNSASTPKIQSKVKLEPSLDRLSTMQVKPAAAQRLNKPRVHDVQISRQEDVDLLRASDIRASTKSARRTKKEQIQAKNDQRQALERDFTSQNKDESDDFKNLTGNVNRFWQRIQEQQKVWLAGKVLPSPSSAEKVISSNGQRVSQSVKKPADLGGSRGSTSRSAKVLDTFTPSPEVLNAEKLSQARTLSLRQASLDAKRHDQELQKKQQALGEQLKEIYETEYGPINAGSKAPQRNRDAKTLVDDVGANKFQTVARTQSAQAPESVIATEKSRSLEAKKEQQVDAISPLKTENNPTAPVNILSTTKGLEGEVAQVDVPAVASSHSNPPFLYKVLAYDSSTLQMTIAETTSSVPSVGEAENQPQHPTEILSRLNNVAKFLPHFSEMETQGYEIVSGSGDVLVFKKVRDSIATNPPRNQGMEQGDQKLPGGSVDFLGTSTAPSAGASPKVRRQEDVFSGSAQSWHQEEGSSIDPDASSDTKTSGGVGRLLKKVFLAGSVTAVVAYSVGVIAEKGGSRYDEDGPRRRERPGIYSTEASR